MAIGYDEISDIAQQAQQAAKAMRQRPTLGQTIGNVGQAIAQGLQGRQFIQQELPENQMASDLMKTMILQRIKQENIPQAQQTEGLERPGYAIEKITSGGPTWIPKRKVTEKQAERATGLRKEFTGLNIIKDYNVIERSYDALNKAYELSTRNGTSLIASDQAIAVLFQKMLDPQSVVRESEYARTPQGAAFINRIESIIPQLQRGGLRLTDEDRYAILEQAKALLDSAQDKAREKKSFYTGLSKAQNINPAMVTGGFSVLPRNIEMKPAQPQQLTQQPQQPQLNFNSIEEAESAQLQPGTIIYVQGRKAIVE